MIGKKVGVSLQHATCPHCLSRRERTWAHCWRCSTLERDEFEQVLDRIADSQKLRDDLFNEPPDGFADYDDMSGREWDGGYTHKYPES